MNIKCHSCKKDIEILSHSKCEFANKITKEMFESASSNIYGMHWPGAEHSISC